MRGCASDSGYCRKYVQGADRRYFQGDGASGGFLAVWNHDVESYMEQRIQNNHEQRAMKSFPEYMNVFITEHQNIRTYTIKYIL